jgi:trehalose 2-sulfotransferase
VDSVRDATAQYHAGAIGHLVELLRAQADGWSSWFAEEDIMPIQVSYPDLGRNLPGVTATILEALGLDPGLTPDPEMNRQADDRSRQWVQQYLADAELLGLPI